MNRVIAGALIIMSLVVHGNVQGNDDTPPASVFVTMISHFDRPWVMTAEDLQAFEMLTKNHPRMRWTHLFNPAAYTQPTPLLKEMEQFVTHTRDHQGAEVGVHLHMYESVVKAAGVSFRTGPSVNARVVEGSRDRTGYSVPLSSYSRDDIGALLKFTCKTFETHGLGKPATFCAGYYTTNLDVQREIAAQGFTTSAAAFPPGTEIGKAYPPSWRELCGWDESVRFDTLPYRISQTTILPGGGPPYLENSDGGPLVEIPQTCKIDWMVTAEDMKAIFQKHLAIARQGRPTAVCLAIHEMDAKEHGPKYDEVLRYIDEHISSSDQAVRVRYCTASQVREEFIKHWAR